MAHFLWELGKHGPMNNRYIRMLLALCSLGMANMAQAQTTFTVSKDTICYNSSIRFVNTTTGIDSLKWLVNGIRYATDSISVMFTDSGSANVTLYTWSGGSEDSASRTVYVRPLVYENVLVTVSPMLVISYPTTTQTWYYNGSVIPGATSNELTPTELGCYYAILDTGSCYFGITDTICVTDESVNNIDRQNDAINLYPNPVSTQLKITSALPITTYSIYDITGRILLSGKCNAKLAAIDVSSLDHGLYFIRVNELEIERFIKE
jgi:Secretion system C-terminal sorting domain